MGRDHRPLNISAHVLEAGVAGKGRPSTSPRPARSNRGETGDIVSCDSKLCLRERLRESLTMSEQVLLLLVICDWLLEVARHLLQGSRPFSAATWRDPAADGRSLEVNANTSFSRLSCASDFCPDRSASRSARPERSFSSKRCWGSRSSTNTLISEKGSAHQQPAEPKQIQRDLPTSGSLLRKTDTPVATLPQVGSTGSALVYCWRWLLVASRSSLPVVSDSAAKTHPNFCYEHIREPIYRHGTWDGLSPLPSCP
jgi:hypothetical protein